MKSKLLFTQEFLCHIEAISNNPLDYLLDRGFTFKESILRLCECFDIEPKYVDIETKDAS